MEIVTLLTDLFNTFALPVVMIIIFIVAIVNLFKEYKTRDEKKDAEVKELTEKYYESYSKVTESNVKVSEALNNNTRVIEKLMDKLS